MAEQGCLREHGAKFTLPRRTTACLVDRFLYCGANCNAPMHQSPENFSWHLWEPYHPPQIFGYYHVLFADGRCDRAEYLGRGQWWLPQLGYIIPLFWREETDLPALTPLSLPANAPRRM